MDGMRKSRLNVYKQDRLIEHFVSGSTARTAGALVGVNKTTAAYFFYRLREIIVLESEQESHEVFEGEIEVDESYFGGRRKGKRGCGAGGKTPVFAIYSVEEGSTRRLYLMHLPRRCIRLLNARWCRTVLFILIIGEATTYSMCQTLSISGLTTPYFLQTRKIISTA